MEGIYKCHKTLHFSHQGVCLALKYSQSHKARHSSYWKKGVCLNSKQSQVHEVKHSSFQEEGNYFQPHI